ncbi:hypothetical protein A2U01_0095444, partial [Trifolium medium]|nr:hypothetical protein [Trifolium medium]
VFSIVEDDWESVQNWEVHCPHPTQRICSKFPEEGFGMYEFNFKDLRLRSIRARMLIPRSRTYRPSLLPYFQAATSTEQ